MTIKTSKQINQNPNLKLTHSKPFKYDTQNLPHFRIVVWSCY
ncbi:hypothetical protein HMPREF9103_00240 [Lentilactobacillus parafarraginis F0439]|uniref:Uncharacterized protein n=1 Tax=Lentilactobacillus parafarraginis F0439 TaxID=797515 RepID=G9ZKJ1_9LACO|nr:hypothetical protein HMPREF9103_00240 [Lentilactobacillus parafarraginis F0439]